MNKTNVEDGTVFDQHGATLPESALVERPRQALAAAYEEMYTAVLALLDRVGARQLSTVVPACPAWKIRDLVAHMTGTAADAITARFPVVNPHGPWAERQSIIDAFTAGQVASREGLSLDEVLAEWAEHVPILAHMLRGNEPFPAGSIPIIDWMVVCDLTVHNQDIRGALNLPGERDSAGVVLSLRRYVVGVGQRITAAGLPALRLRTENCEYIAGEGWPTSTVSTTRWELFRALSSRRSASQIGAYDWSGDADQYVPLFGAYGVPIDDLVE